MSKPRIYTASKMDHAELWRELANKYYKIHFTARWPYLEPFVSPSIRNAERFWVDDLEDISRSDAVLVYACEGEHLRGALVEAGMGIALGKRIILVHGTSARRKEEEYIAHPDFSTWQWHSSVRRYPYTLEKTLEVLSEFGIF